MTRANMIWMREVVNHRRFKLSLLFAVLGLGATLRMAGLSWGLARGYHPDEIVSMRGVVELDPLAGDLRAPAAYFEGTFNYYLWSLPVAAIRLLNVPDRNEWRPIDDAHLDDTHFAWILFVSRLMTVAFDTVTTLVVFLAAAEAIKAFYPALAGAFLYAIIPVQVIYAHFMRPHILANLLCALVIWLSFKLIRIPKWWLCLLAGFLSGLAAATRYPAGVIVVVPCLCLMFVKGPIVSRRGLWKAMLFVLSGPVWWVALGFAAGLFIGAPILFLDPHSVFEAFSNETLRFIPVEQFRARKLFNLSAIWKYLSVLIPYGMWPLMWIIPYSAILYLLLRRRLIPFIFPLLVFSLLYLYPMAKGYFTGLFARAAMLLFPGFSILTALACYELFFQSNFRHTVRRVVGIVALIVALPSLIFDVAYVRAMQQPDPRAVLRENLQRWVGFSTVQIGIHNSGGFFYTILPAIKSIRKRKIIVRLQGPKQRADFYIVGLRTSDPPERVEKSIKRVENSGNFFFLKKYSTELRPFGYKLDLSSFPPDMTYPFPQVLLFRSPKFVPYRGNEQ